MEGNQGQDSTLVHLSIHQDTITGSMDWMPWEKDARKGKLHGFLHQDTLNLTWSYMQEGLEDTLGLRFLWKGDTLQQQELEVDSQTGRLYTADKGDFSIDYLPISCQENEAQSDN